jgi:hypothetical protein
MSGEHRLAEPVAGGNASGHAASQERAPAARQSGGDTVHSQGGLELARDEQFDLAAELDFPGQRPAFREGNRLAEVHGLRSRTLRVTERSRELAEWLRALAEELGVYRPAFDPLYALAGMSFEKVERYDRWSGQFTEAGDFDRATAAEQAARAWWNRALRSLTEAGLTAASFARARRDAAIGESAWRTLERHLETTYGDEGGA